MTPLLIGGRVWGVVRVSPDDPLLVDRTGHHSVATADPVTKVIRISSDVLPPLFDQVYLHEATHAMMEESGVTDLLSQLVDGEHQVSVEELVAWFLETHAIEVIDAVSRSLGRPVCVGSICMEGMS